MKQKIAKKEEKDTKINNDKLEKEKISLENNLKKDKETKQIPQEALKDIFKNIIIAIGVIIYFAILNFTYFKIEQEKILSVIEICSGVLLLAALILLEIAYKKDSGKFTISAIEFLVLAFHSLSIKYVITRYDYQLQFYLLTSSYVISIYFILKAIIIYTKGRKKYLDTLSDIPEILKKDEPVKKEAKKRSEVVEKPKVVENKPKSKRGTKRKKIEPEKEIENSENKKTTKKSKTKKEDSKADKKTETKKTSKSTKTLKEEKSGEDVSKRKTKKADSKTKKEEKEDKEDLKVKDEEKKKSVKTKKKTSKKEE